MADWQLQACNLEPQWNSGKWWKPSFPAKTRRCKNQRLVSTRYAGWWRICHHQIGQSDRETSMTASLDKNSVNAANLFSVKGVWYQSTFKYYVSILNTTCWFSILALRVNEDVSMTAKDKTILTFFKAEKITAHNEWIMYYGKVVYQMFRQQPFLKITMSSTSHSRKVIQFL